MIEFRWLALEEALRHGWEIPDPAFVDALVKEVLEHRVPFPAGQSVFRARVVPVGREDETEPLICAEMGSPPNVGTKGGRLNPNGVSYFYCALDSETAVAEVRPWRGARVSIAEFTPTRRLTVVDLASSQALGPLAGWASFMMARPVHREDGEGYTCTQLLAARLAVGDVQGILYGSAMNPDGVNSAFFTDAHFTCVARELREVSQVKVSTAVLWDGRKENGGWPPVGAST